MSCKTIGDKHDYYYIKSLIDLILICHVKLLGIYENSLGGTILPLCLNYS